MTKGYWIGRVDVHDTDAYGAYVEAAAPVFAEYGARFLVRGGHHEGVEGPSRSRNVVIEFESVQRALDCWRSPGYQRARLFRTEVSEAEIVIVEGHEP